MNILAYQGISFVSKLVRFQTRSIYSHIGIEDPDTRRVIEALAQKFQVVLADDFRQYHTPGTVVDVFHVDLPDPELAWHWAMDQVGMPYDFRGVFRFLTRVPATINGAWFCSELGARFCEIGGNKIVRLRPEFCAPRDLPASMKLEFLERRIV